MTQRSLLLVLFLSVTRPAAWAQDPAGAEFQVNTYTTDWQRDAAVSSAANGDFVVVWDSWLQDGSSGGVFGQRFSASGVPQASEFQVNSYTMSLQYWPAVSSAATGNFVVVWNSSGQDGSYWGVFGQRFNASGVPQGAEFRVNTYTMDHQYGAAVASDATGNFVVVWSSYRQDGSGDGVFGQRFNAAGVPQGSEFRVNTYTTGNQWTWLSSVASDPTGNFVVVWSSRGQDGQEGSDDGVFGQRFNASGVSLGSEFRANSYTTGNQSWPAVASDANGSFVVVWEDSGQDATLTRAVFGQRYDAAGLPQGTEFRVNSYTTGDQYGPVVAFDASGNFVVVWSSYGQDGSGTGIFGQRFDAAGLPQGSEFQVNSYTTSHQYGAAAAAAANGNFVVVWGASAQDGSDWGVFGQRYGDLIFKDGFE